MTLNIINQPNQPHKQVSSFMEEKKKYIKGNINKLILLHSFEIVFCWPLSLMLSHKWFEPPHFLKKCLYQARKVSSHVYVCQEYQFSLCFYNFAIRFYNCSDGVVLFVFLFYSIKSFLYSLVYLISDVQITELGQSQFIGLTLVQPSKLQYRRPKA